MRQLFLPSGLILSVLFSLTLPSAGLFLADNNGLKILVFIIFLVSGHQTGRNALALDRRLGTIFFAAILISLVLGPLLGLFAGRILNYPFYLAMGLIITGTVPPTLSSGVVITEVSGGNTSLALFLTISLNLLGIISIPFILDLFLKAAGPVDIDQFSLFIKMFFLVLLPFGTGKMLQMLPGPRKNFPFLSYINSSCVILIVYSSLATSRQAFSGLLFADYMLIVTGVAMVHLPLLLAGFAAGKTLQLKTADTKALVFVSSQKTLPIAIAILASIAIDTGDAIIVCLIFHFFQLFIDSLLAMAVQRHNNFSLAKKAL